MCLQFLISPFYSLILIPVCIYPSLSNVYLCRLCISTFMHNYYRCSYVVTFMLTKVSLADCLLVERERYRFVTGYTVCFLN